LINNENTQALTSLILDDNNLHVKIISIKDRTGLEEPGQYFMEQCRLRGIRVTTQRLAVFQALAQTTEHPTADSLYARLRITMPSLSLSTVYRILESLESQGLIRKVSSTNGVVRYDGNYRPHQHLVCRICGRISDLKDDYFSSLQVPRQHLSGFHAEELEIRILGTCAECVSASKSVRSSQQKTQGELKSSSKKGEKGWRN
jgi:Fur family transcriptional regulator, peroxide stress response regulator